MKTRKTMIISLLAAMSILFTYIMAGTGEIMAVSEFTFDTTTGYITGYNGTATDVVIPAEIEGYTIRGIKEGCFKNKDITTIEIPDTVTEIEKNVFNGCSHLKEINMSNQVTAIGEYAFSGCSAIKKVEVPYSVKTIGKNAFEKCTSLKKVTIPYSVSSIGTGVFSGCSSLVSIVYQAQEAEIPESFCEDCISLSYFEIPDNITTIGQSAFEGCKSLQSISIPAYVDTISAYAYKDCTGLKNIYIPENVSSVGYQAFANCTGLKTAILDNEHFGRISGACTETSCEAFLNCTNLTDVKILNNMTNLGEGNTFKGCSSLVNITIPGNVVTIADNTFSDCNDNLTIYCKQNSEALNMALANGINYSFASAPEFDNSAAAPIIEKDIDVAINNQYLYFDQDPIIESGRTLVPLRTIFEALGATVDWNSTTQTITATRNGTNVTMTIGSNIMYKNNSKIELDVAPQIVGNRTLVPARAVAEAFDCTVEWDDEMKTVVIAE